MNYSEDFAFLILDGFLGNKQDILFCVERQSCLQCLCLWGYNLEMLQFRASLKNDPSCFYFILFFKIYIYYSNFPPAPLRMSPASGVHFIIYHSQLPAFLAFVFVTCMFIANYTTILLPQCSRDFPLHPY